MTHLSFLLFIYLFIYFWLHWVSQFLFLNFYISSFINSSLYDVIMRNIISFKILVENLLAVQ